MKIGDIEIKRTYRPTRIVCDAASLAALVVIVKNGLDLLITRKFLGFAGVLPLLFPAVGIGLCVAYVLLTFRSRKFKRYKITKLNAQSVYERWAFSLALAKVPLLIALFEGEYMFLYWAATGQSKFSVMIPVYVLLSVIIIRLMMHRIKSLTAFKKVQKDDKVVKVRAKIDDDDHR